LYQNVTALTKSRWNFKCLQHFEIYESEKGGNHLMCFEQIQN